MRVRIRPFCSSATTRPCLLQQVLAFAVQVAEQSLEARDVR